MQGENAGFIAVNLLMELVSWCMERSDVVADLVFAVVTTMAKGIALAALARGLIWAFWP